ncbi:MAG: cupin domain-containing protein [Chromatiales bacterium]|jgi:mannose-6-phosphate isomerase-like protein (cupin superfamily)
MTSQIKSNTDTEEYFFEEGCYIRELWNSAADDAMSIAQVRLPAGDETRLHLLINTVERYLILQGEALVWLDEAPAQVVVADDLVLIGSGQHQKIRNTGDGDLLFLALCTPRFEMQNYRDCDEQSSG